ncbi:hypothetical protein TRFO_05698 [Tritrichomonas foetus]|uniref:Initiator binding domain-containing protein n=1 Tax=Tritrichomonas foetus TaxID=1144522 RepID=A0A1J4K8L5_9EUKA|nr:hypothetical protein TRFO_05698 [Tritrichomonas foetus]|eukprot:OHT06052.1 hypothetical protein TRFO_05698 [Tritrichomonas foetus]
MISNLNKHHFSTFPSLLKSDSLLHFLILSNHYFLYSHNDMSTFQELQSQLGSFSKGSKKKFVVKVFICLQFVEKNPEFLEKIGTKWCTDGCHFVTNSIILGKFLNLKSNSVNTNFREYGFPILPSHTDSFQNEFSDIVNTRHWKIRYEQSYSFSRNLDISNILKINSLKIKMVDSFNSVLPRIHLPQQTAILLEHDQSQRLAMADIISQLKNDRNWIDSFLTVVTTTWTSLFSPIPFCRIDDITEYLDSLYPQCNSFLIFNKYRLFNNLISFQSFVKIFLRYGNTENPIHFCLSIINESHEFIPWFIPKELMNKEYSKDNTWFLTEGKELNSFELYTKSNNEHTKYTIYNDPINKDLDKRASIQINNTTLYAKNINELLFNVLNLNEDQSFHSFNINKQQQNINENNSNKDNCIGPDFYLSPNDETSYCYYDFQAINDSIE